MRFSFADNMFRSAYSDTEWILKLSETFLKYFALMVSLRKTTITIDTLMQQDLLMEVKVQDNTIYKPYRMGNTLPSPTGFQNLHVLYFKGQDIRTHVGDPTGQSENTYYIINPIIALAFLDQCINYLNIYEHEKIRNIIKDQEEGESIGGTSDSSTRNAVKNSFPDYPIGEKRISLSL
jgi:hypothetical protein